MFKWLFLYWYNTTDSPSNVIKYNIWTYTNLRYFRNKTSSYILYFILSLNNLKFKKIKVFYKVLSFEYFYIRLLYLLIYMFIFFSLVIIII